MLCGKSRLFGKDGDASLALDRKGVKVGVLMIDAPERSYASRKVEQRFRQRGLTRVHMGKNSDGQFFSHALSPFVNFNDILL
jgi:hypothetical protein